MVVRNTDGELTAPGSAGSRVAIIISLPLALAGEAADANPELVISTAGIGDSVRLNAGNGSSRSVVSPLSAHPKVLVRLSFERLVAVVEEMLVVCSREPAAETSKGT